MKEFNARKIKKLKNKIRNHKGSIHTFYIDAYERDIQLPKGLIKLLYRMQLSANKGARKYWKNFLLDYIDYQTNFVVRND